MNGHHRGNYQVNRTMVRVKGNLNTLDSHCPSLSPTTLRVAVDPHCELVRLHIFAEDNDYPLT